MESVSIRKRAAPSLGGYGAMSSVRTPTSLGTHGTARSGSEPKMWRTAAWRGRAGQAFVLREGMVSDFVLGSYVLSSKPKTKSDTVPENKV